MPVYYFFERNLDMLCSYCQTENESGSTCSFCKADLQVKRPTIREDLTQEEAELSQPVLATYHTYDLLLLLRHMRQERSTYYKLMQTVRKAPDGVEVPTDTISFAESEYRRYTAHMRVIEGILIDRLGYKPKRVDDKLLGALKAKIGITK